MIGLRLLADENIATPLVRTLREAGIDVIYVAEFASGITDDEVLERARKEDRLLLTEDKDFGELVFRMKRELAGVIMLRLPCAPGSSHWGRLQTVLNRHGNKLKGHYTVIEKNRVRFRPLADT
jgi:predicted nuclease of predicted toxin-antitoxin system